MIGKKIKFRDYKNYPIEVMNAARFRDDYDELSDGAFFAIAEELGIYEEFIELTEFENANTYDNPNVDAEKGE